jgi:hypothetical protein
MLFPSANRVTRISRWILVLSLVLITLPSKGQRLPDNLFQRWIHSFEEDTSGTQVFRPVGYPFPPARGRDGFEIRRDGSFTLLGPGRSDRSTAITGHWERTRDRMIEIRFEQSSLNRTVQILELKPQLLRIKR